MLRNHREFNFGKCTKIDSCKPIKKVLGCFPNTFQGYRSIMNDDVLTDNLRAAPVQEVPF